MHFVNKDRTRDFTTGSIFKHLIDFSWPMFLGNFLQALYNTVDTFWVGRFLGTEALAAVSASFPIIFFLVALAIGFTMATTILVSQYYGAKDEVGVRKVINTSLFLMVISAIIITSLGLIFYRQIFELINLPESLIEPASQYLIIFLSGLIFAFLYNVISAIMRGFGDSLTPLYFLAIATVVNIILDPLFILGIGPIPEMGISGVAYATIIAQGLSAILGLFYLFRKAKVATWDRSLIKPDGYLLKQLITIGTPAGIQQALVSVAMLFLASLVNKNGEIVVAAYGLGGRIDQFAFMPAQSVSLAVSTLVAQNLGANKPERVKEIWKYSNLLVIGIALVATSAIWFFPDFWVRIFTPDLTVREMTTIYLRIVSLSYIAYSLMFSTGGLSRGAGDTFISMGISLLSLWFVRLPLATFLSETMQMGPRGIFLGIALSPIVGFALNYVYYRSSRWQSRNLTEGRRSPVPELEE